jgi:hypothetical protein
MGRNYGAENWALTRAIRGVARGSERVRFRQHAQEQMDVRGFDHNDVMQCLRKGTAYGPEFQSGELRANVVHRGLKIRVVVGSIEQARSDWSQLRAVSVITVIGEE